MIEESSDIKQPILDNKERSYATGKKKKLQLHVFRLKKRRKVKVYN